MPQNPRTEQRQPSFVQRAYHAAVVRPLEPASLWVKLLIGVGLAALPGLFLAIVAMIQAGVLTSARPRLLFEVIGAFLLVLFLDAIGALYVAGQILAPVEAIRTAAKRWKQGDFSARIEIVPSSAEFGTLVDNLNSMAGSLEESRVLVQDAEQRLRLETDRLRAILDTSPVGILVMGSDETIRLANPASEALLGETFVPTIPGRLYGVVKQLYRPDGQRYPYEDLPIVESLRNGIDVIGAEVVVRRPNGWEEHLLVNSAPIRNGAGKISGSVAVFFDVSALAEEERLRNEFVSSAAHEFRNPLTVIKGYAEIAMRDPTVKETPVYRELLRILDAANRVEKLAEDLQHAAQMHLTPIILHKEVVDLGALARTVVEQARESDPEHEYDLQVKSPAVFVEGDPALLREAIDDVMRQARAVSPSGCKVVVKVWTWDGITNLSVTDFGPRVSAEAIPALFNPFSAVVDHEAGQQRPALLLYLAKRIVEESGGWIRAESSAAGTSITITLPRYVPAGSPVTTAAPTSRPPQPGPNGRTGASSSVAANRTDHRGGRQ